MRQLFFHKFNKSPFNQNSKLTIGEVSFILKQTVMYATKHSQGFFSYDPDIVVLIILICQTANKSGIDLLFSSALEIKSCFIFSVRGL